MEKYKAELAVVGGGPSGLIAAREAASRGREVILLEEHREIGFPCHCAGLLSIKGLAELGIPLREDFVRNIVKGASFFSPSGLSFTVERDEPVAAVVERGLLDKFLAEEASRTGVEITLNSKVKRLRRDHGSVSIIGEGFKAEVDLVIDAEGISQKLIRGVGLQPSPERCKLPAMQLDLAGVTLDPDYVEIHVGSKFAPGFVAWVIPLGDGEARVGLACKRGKGKVKDRLERFLRERFGDSTKPIEGSNRSGLITTCGPIAKTYTANLLVVGDAAGHVKPLTGGGVIPGGLCASIAGRVAAEAVEAGDFSETFLGRYEEIWRRRFWSEFKVARLVRSVADRLSDKSIDRIFKAVIEGGVYREISAWGDMDFHGRSIIKLLGNTDFWRALPSTLGGLARSLLTIMGKTGLET